ncbi:24417_t:CDS:2, partial [Racocetra persica]
TSFTLQCFPPHAGLGPVMPSINIIEPSANSYSMNKPLLISWKGFLIDDNPELQIQLWRKDTHLNDYPKDVYYENLTVNWVNWITPNESDSEFSIRIFKKDNHCIHGISSTFNVTD